MTDEEKLNEIAKNLSMMMAENMPESLKGSHVVALCEQLISSYADDLEEAFLWMVALAEMLRSRYEGECMCEKCVAEREKQLH